MTGAGWCLCKQRTHGGAAESCHMILLGESSQHVDIPLSAVSPLEESECWYIQYNVCTLWGHFFLSAKKITLSFIKISQLEEILEKKSGKGQVPRRDGGGGIGQFFIHDWWWSARKEPRLTVWNKHREVTHAWGWVWTTLLHSYGPAQSHTHHITQ